MKVLNGNLMLYKMPSEQMKYVFRSKTNDIYSINKNIVELKVFDKDEDLLYTLDQDIAEAICLIIHKTVSNQTMLSFFGLFENENPAELTIEDDISPIGEL